MPKIRVRSAKPNTKGSYNQGRKLGKERNHNHLWHKVEQFNKVIEYCRVPTCKAKRLIK